MSELALASTDGELSLSAQPASPNQQQSSEAEHQKKARRAVEPQGQATGRGFDEIGAGPAQAQRVNTIHIQNFKVGERYDVMAPYLRQATVVKVAGSSCIVKSKIFQNVPRKGDKGQLLDHWLPVEWQEAWAIKTLEFEDPTRPGKMWTERHVVVTEESRPENLRSTQQSPIKSSYVRLVPATEELTPPDGAQEASNIEMPKFEDLTRGALLRIAGERGIESVTTMSKKEYIIEKLKEVW